MRRLLSLLVALAALGLPALAGAAPPPALTLTVDAREAPRRILHARLTVPASAGRLTLVYPKWIPGEHAPVGPINDLTGLQITAGGKPVAWQRDAEDLYAFHVEVPREARALELAFDLVTAAGGRGASSPATASARLVRVSWNQVVLYPRGADPRTLQVTAAVRLPPGWRFATALPPAGKTADGASFKPVSLETLVDSPLLAGAHGKTVDLSPRAGPPHTLHLYGDSPEAVELSADTAAAYRRLVAEAGALFGAHHYRRYDFLLALSEFLPWGGLEHHESSDNRVPERTLIDDAVRPVRAGLLPHEMVHSWNGKHRRPAGLVTADFQQPMRTELLWVYEGLTTYLGELLTARSGLRSAEEARAALALTAATMDVRAGRTWRPLADTAVAAPVLSGAVREWRSWRRGLDYYPESQLVWLEADTIIRSTSGGQRTLDDFCRRFHGQGGGAPSVVPYSLDDVVAALQAVAPHDWRGFFAARVYAITPRAPLAGIEQAGWRLVYKDTPPPFFKNAEQAAKEIDLSYSLGLVLREDGSVIDVIPGSPAAAAGLGPAMKVVAVGGRRFSRDVLRAAVQATKTRPDLDLLVESDDFFRTHHLAVRGGDRYPALERDPARPDVLGQILAPLVRQP
jgi:predicted metalloprotease with PDZ domain